MELYLEHTSVNSLNLSRLSPEKEEEFWDMDFTVTYPDEAHLEVLFNLQIVNLEDNFELQVDYFARFKTSEPIQEDFKQSAFPNVNASAIAFPFLRSFVATLILNAGYNPIFLPSVNFEEWKGKKTN